MPSVRVAIIGGGLTGLCCARRLVTGGMNCCVFEASDCVGGQLRTDEVDGFLLDRGFHVLFDSYPEAQDILDFDALGSRAFKPGALIRLHGKTYRFDDPWRRPAQVFGQLFSPIATATDKLHIVRIRRRVTAGSLSTIFNREELPTIDYLRREGFSESIIEHFFRPFFGGVWLDRSLTASSHIFEFVFRMLSLGNAILPARGMQSIPQQIAESLPPDTIRLNSRVTSIENGTLLLESGEQISADYIVLAADESAIARFLNRPPRNQWRGVTCLYFDAPAPPVEQSIVVLNGEATGLVNSICVPSLLAPHYAPQGRSLVSATVLGDPTCSDEKLSADVLNHMQNWFGDQVLNWRHLRTYRIRQAQPDLTTVSRPPRGKPTEVQPRLFVCGDAVEAATINGAMRAGRRVAEEILSRLQQVERGHTV